MGVGTWGGMSARDGYAGVVSWYLMGRTSVCDGMLSARDGERWYVLVSAGRLLVHDEM